MQEAYGKHDNACTFCGLNEYWVSACRISKHFVELYQASIKGKGVESHSADNADNIEINNAWVLHTVPINEVPLAPIEAKSLDISNFFKDQDKKAKSLGWWQNDQT